MAFVLHFIFRFDCVLEKAGWIIGAEHRRQTWNTLARASIDSNRGSFRADSHFWTVSHRQRGTSGPMGLPSPSPIRGLALIFHLQSTMGSKVTGVTGLCFLVSWLSSYQSHVADSLPLQLLLLRVHLGDACATSVYYSAFFTLACCFFLPCHQLWIPFHNSSRLASARERAKAADFCGP